MEDTISLYELDQASKLGTVEDIAGAVQLSSILFYCITPWIVLFIVIYAIRRLRKKLKRNKINKLFNDDEYMFSQIDYIRPEPIDKRKYRSLALEFDTKGRVIERTAVRKA